MIYSITMYHNSFLESKRYAKLHIENNLEVRNQNLAPFIVEGGSVFKKQSFFLGSLVIGDHFGEKEGQIVYRNGEFMGYNGAQWCSFTRENLWMEGGEGVITTEGKRIGINKINPKKTLEVGGDAVIDKKLHIGDILSCNNGIVLAENQTKKRSGMIRFWENRFEGFDGEKWINFSGGSQEASAEAPPPPEIDLGSIQAIGLLNCPLSFIQGGSNRTHIWFDWDKECYNMGRLLEGNMEMIKRDNLHIRELSLDGDIIMNGKSTIRNVADPQNSDEVATKRYVDTISQGLQNYMIVRFLLFEEDVEFMENQVTIRLRRDVGDISKFPGATIGVILKTGATLMEVLEFQEGDLLHLKYLQEIQPPAKLCVQEGRYGNSEYFVFNKNDEIGYLQVNGMENLEYEGCIRRKGKKVELTIGPMFQSTPELTIKEGAIGANLLGNGAICSNHLSDGCVRAPSLANEAIENRHLGKGVVNGSNIEERTITAKHLKEGCVKTSHMGAGIITDHELSSECIHMTHLKPAIILQRHLTKNSVTGENLMDGIIERRHLLDKIILTSHLNEEIILSNHIANGQIQERHLTPGIIQETHIQLEQIRGYHIREREITGAHLAIGSIDGLLIKEESIGGGNIKEHSILSRHFTRGCIADWNIGDGQIKGRHFEEASIDGGKIAPLAIWDHHIQHQAINADHIKKGAIHGAHLTLNSVDDKHIVNASIKTMKLMDGAVTETKMGEGSVTTNKIKDKTITNDKLKLPFLKIETDAMFIAPKMVHLGETLQIGLNQNYMIPRKRDGVVEFMGAVRFGEEGSGQTMEVHMELDVRGKMRVAGETLFFPGEIRSVAKGVKMDEKRWLLCDGKRVKRSQYYELYRAMEEKKEDGDDFYLPDVKHDAMEYYIRSS
jgi:hypothetical protein